LGNGFSVQLELGADCFAGLYVKYAETLKMVEPGDIATLAKGFYDTGGDLAWFDPQGHGTKEQRYSSFVAGYQGGINPCLAIIANAPGPVLDVPPFKLAVLNGSKVQQIEGVQRMTPPVGSQTVDVRGYIEGKVPGTGRADQRGPEIATSWFSNGGPVNFEQTIVEKITVNYADGPTYVSIGRFVSAEETFVA
jgi:hypothetical protein